VATSIGFNIFARDQASGVFARISHSVSGLGKTAALALGTVAVGGVAALGAAMVQGVKDAADYQTLAAKTAAVLKSTGNVAHQSVKGIQERAAALESMSGVDETLMINGQNVLATFTRVRDGVGKGNDIFNRATTAALNLSTALGTDMQSASILVGKALNDPVRGLTALRRAGVSFTKEQQDQIKTLVESGHTMQAQKIILGELNKEFGGSAAAAGKGFAGSMARAKDAVGDAFRAIGTGLLPVLTTMANYVAVHAGPVIHTLGSGLKALVGAFQEGDVTSTGFVGVMERIGVAARAVWGFIQQLVVQVRSFAIDFAAGVGVAGALRTALTVLGGAFLTVAKFVGQNLDVIIPLVGIAFAAVKVFQIITAVTRAWAIVQLFLNGTLVANPIGLVIAAIAILIGAIVLAYKRSETFRNIVQGAFHGVAAAAQWMWNNVLAPVIRFILRGFATLAQAVGSFLVALGKIPGFGWAKTAGEKMLGAAKRARELASSIRDIPNKSVTVTVSIHAQTGRIKVGNQYVNIGQFASGTPRAPKGWAWVGEQGPELMNLKGGEQIISADQSRAIASARPAPSSAAAGGTTIIVNVNGPTIGTPQTIAQQVHQALLNLKQTSGVDLKLA
jgi:hypothetical protein